MCNYSKCPHICLLCAQLCPCNIRPFFIHTRFYSHIGIAKTTPILLEGERVANRKKSYQKYLVNVSNPHFLGFLFFSHLYCTSIIKSRGNEQFRPWESSFWKEGCVQGYVCHRDCFTPFTQWEVRECLWILFFYSITQLLLYMYRHSVCKVYYKTLQKYFSTSWCAVCATSTVSPVLSATPSLSHCVRETKGVTPCHSLFQTCFVLFFVFFIQPLPPLPAYV